MSEQDAVTQQIAQKAAKKLQDEGLLTTYEKEILKQTERSILSVILAALATERKLRKEEREVAARELMHRADRINLLQKQLDAQREAFDRLDFIINADRKRFTREIERLKEMITQAIMERRT